MAILHRHGKKTIDLDALKDNPGKIDAIWFFLSPESAQNIVQNCDTEAVRELGEMIVSLGNALAASAPPSLRIDVRRFEEGFGSSVYIMGKEINRFSGLRLDLTGAICYAVRSVAEQAAAIEPDEASRIAELCKWSAALRSLAEGLDWTVNATLAGIELRNEQKRNENADGDHSENIGPVS